MISNYSSHLQDSFHPEGSVFESQGALDLSGHISLVRPIADAEACPEGLRLAYTSKKNFLIGAFWLLACILSTSTTGPIVLMIPAKSTYVSISWRSQCSCLIMALWSITGYIRYSRREPSDNYDACESLGLTTWEKIKKDSSPQNLFSTSLMSFFLFIWILGLVLGCKYTLTAHADVLYCSNGVFILLIALLTCQYVHKYEIGGYLVYGVGVLIMLSDPLATKTGEGTNKMLGNFLAISGALGGALFGIVSTKLKRDSDQTVCMFYLFLGHFTIQVLIFPHLEDNPLFFSLDPHFGIFGWLSNPWYAGLMLLFVCPWTSITSNYSLLECYKYWTLDIVAVFFLMEPYFAEIAAILLGQDEIPGSQTFIGVTILSCGIALSIYGSKIKASETMNPKANVTDELNIELSDRPSTEL
ncbi:unnamed protein product [Moneuplotes crassus]|uniref:EamA domain-containing protein n=1 Tax=Euplotes crassus TaxID=5936 RepID=A0AAD1UL37_EUPCR|nr:unnamed protein product [Moneuplotes crassus]